MNGLILRRVSGIPRRFSFAGAADDITKEREPRNEIIERTPKSLIITSFNVFIDTNIDAKIR